MPGDPWAHAGLPRETVRDERGSIVLTHTPVTREGRPCADLAWRLPVEVYRHRASRYAGAGAALLRRALWLATQAKLPALSLVVSDGNPARRVYERLGFRHVGSSRTLELPT